MISLSNLSSILSFVDNRISEYQLKLSEEIKVPNSVRVGSTQEILHNLFKLKGVIENEMACLKAAERNSLARNYEDRGTQ